MRVVSSKQMRKLEGLAISEYGIPSIILMENAALAVVQEIKGELEKRGKILSQEKATIFVGKGNNGGDGLAVGRHLHNLGMEVAVFLLAKPEEYQGDSELNLRLLQGLGVKMFVVEGDKQIRLARLAIAQSAVIVDAIFGTGLKGALPPLAEACVEEINRAKGFVISVDIPSGLEADTGRVYRNAVFAHTTVTFGLPKLGHFLGEGPYYTGRLVVDSISIPHQYLEQEEIDKFVLTDDMVRSMLPKRKFDGHKGTHGKGVLVGGSYNMSGAVILAGLGALRSGIGLLQVITPQNIKEVIDGNLIESTVWTFDDSDEQLKNSGLSIIQHKCSEADALAIGPGLGQKEGFIEILEEILRTIPIPIVFDADALNLLARDIGILGWRQGRGPLILTPHPGEMARLCQCTVDDVQSNRLELAISKAVEWEAVIVLKGAVTIIASPDGRAFLNPTGNPGLGTGGTGDVLTGSILGWLAQGVDPVEAACLGVYLHGKAGDLLAKDVGWSGYTASEVAQMIPKVRFQLERGS